MSMDLKVECPHCDATINEICKEDCSANGMYIRELNKILLRLNLERSGFTLKSKGVKL